MKRDIDFRLTYTILFQNSFAETIINRKLTMKKLLLIAFITLIAVATNAQNSGVISGKVTESEQGFSLPGATLKLNFGNRYATSDQNGVFEFLDVPDGKYL